MENMFRSGRLAVSVGLALLAMACSSKPLGGPPTDGTWTGADAQRPLDFNSPLNWTPTGVPTGVATVAVPSDPNPAIHFSASSTTLTQIRLTTGLGVMIDPAKSVTLTQADGLWMCCDAHSTINGNLAGSVTLDYQPGKPPRHYLDGTGGITGNINHIGGGLVPGGGTPGMGVLTAKGV